MKRHIFNLIFSFALLLPSSALAQPGIPHQFYGAINFLNGAAPAGLTVEVKVDGTTVGSALTSSGKYGYTPNLLFAGKSEGDWSGETAEFFVGGTKATTPAAVTLSRGGYTKLDLTIPLTIGTTVTTTSGGSGGGGGGSPVQAAASSSIGDVNNDHVVNKYDFALLMANWGKTGASVADLNNDNVVNKYDFALLMSRWTI